MSAPIDNVVADLDDSSSSSDEETKQRILSAVWKYDQSHTYLPPESEKQKDVKQPGISPFPKSLRPSTESQYCEEFGVITASPELKSFVAKKLTAYLDGAIAECTVDSTKILPTKYEDDFKLFSTSKEHDFTSALPSVGTKQPIKRKVAPDSSSDSDSEEERQKLASVAVTLEDVIRSQSILSQAAGNEPAQQQTSDLSPATSGDSKECRTVERNKNCLDDLINGNCLKSISNGRKKKKRNRKENSMVQDADEKVDTEVQPTGNTKSNHGNSHKKHKSKHSHKEKHNTTKKATLDVSRCLQNVTDDVKMCTGSSGKKKPHELANQVPPSIYESNEVQTDSLVGDNNNIDRCRVKKAKKKKKHKKDVSI